MDRRFEAINERFEAMDRRFEVINERFEAMDRRFEAIERRFTFMQWFMGVGFSFLAILIAIVRFIP